MNNTVIVAIPSKDDRVWKISSEKVPHMTILFLGDKVPESAITQMIGYVAHATQTSLYNFYLDVKNRATLGEDEADVIFFSKWGLDQVEQFRTYLLRDNTIKTAYESTEQFPEWLPHLTLGYPETPAHEDDRDYPGIHGVHFDKIALWTGDYEGYEFPLKAYEYEETMAMSTSERGEQAVNELLHFGVKGMRWGIRNRSDTRSGPVKTSISKTKSGKVEISTTGGGKSTAAVDAVRAAQAQQKLRTSGIKSLSNQELQALTRRAELEAKIAANADTPMNKIKKQTNTINTGTNAVKAVMGVATTAAAVLAYRNTPQGKLIEEAIKKAMVR